MIALILAAVVIPDFSTERALRLLQRDSDVVQSCRRIPKPLGTDEIELQLLSSNPELVLIKGYNPCVCGAHNCPFWVYRVRGPEDERVMESWGYSLKVVPVAGDAPDLVVIGHDSAAISDAARYSYRNGKYDVSESWRLRGDERKPLSLPVHFAAGASSAQLKGKVGIQWGDIYTFEANKGQSLEISGMRGQPPAVIHLKGNGIDRILTPGHAVTLPSAGKYSIDVEPPDDGTGDDRDVAYAFTLSIH